MKQIYFSTKLYFHSTSPVIKDISSSLTIVTCISFYTSEQYTIKIFNSSDQNFDLLFAPTEFAFNAWFGSLDRDQLLPEVTLGFLEKDLLPPEDSSFSLGIQLETYI